jgi:hypothetical protein
MRAQHTHTRLAHEERGIALIAALMIVLLMSALMIGFTTVVMSDQRYRGIDKDRTRAYYGAQSGLEKLSTDLGNLFLDNVSPTAAQIAALANTPPTIPSVTFVAPAGVTAYGVTSILIPCNSGGVITMVATCSAPIGSGPYQGLIALKKQYQLDAVARTTAGGEAHLIRKMESVAIPVFQFGMFSDVDLAFFAGPNFNFGGRVHTNGNLFLAEGGGNTLTLTDKVTAVKDIIRQKMQNGVDITTASTHDGIISMATSTNAFRNLAATEGSLTAGPGSALNPNWHTVSIGYYNGYIRDGGVPDHTAAGTGAKVLNLPVITVGGANTDLSRRPLTNEDPTSTLFGERDFGKVSVRILLSDKPGDITGLPTVSATAPIPLGEVGGVAPDWRTAVPVGSGLVAVDATHPPIARSPGAFPAAFKTNGTTNGTGDTNLTYVAGTLPIALGALQVHAPTILTTVSKAGAIPATQTMTCTVVTMTQLQNCTPTVAWTAMAANSTASVTVNGVTYSTSNITNAIAAGGTAAKTFTVNGGTAPYDGTKPWGLNTFWVQAIDNPQFTGGNAAYNNYPTLVTCTGVDTPNNRFTGCAGSLQGLTATPKAYYLPKTATNTPIQSYAMSAANTGLVGGYIKIEIQKADTTWQDVTAEILNWGISAPAEPVTPGVAACAGVNPNSIIHLQRARYVVPTTNGAGGNYTTDCMAAGSMDSYDYWPLVVFDTREGLLRDTDPGDGRPTLGGLMHYVEIDVANLSKWFKCSAPYNVGVCNGVNVLTNNGYSVYFSDRRNNVYSGAAAPLPNQLETGEYGFEDFVNPASATGLPVNNVLDGGEDVNANNILDVYGELPSSVSAANLQVANSLPIGGVASQGGTASYAAVASVRPWLTMNYAEALVNRPYLFRRSLRLTNGSLGNIVTPGFTVVTENPVYIDGDYNANQASTLANFGDPHSETSIVGDAITLLSNNWKDWNSFVNPYNPGNFNWGDRTRSAQSWYRVAIIAGKGMAFPWPAAGNPPNDFGTDGGAHNFLRYLESGNTLNYRGAIATFYYNRQAVGTFKCCNTVYGAPTRNYNFDTDFLNPATLPPLTPVFRDMNALGFAQEIRPGK